MKSRLSRFPFGWLLAAAWLLAPARGAEVTREGPAVLLPPMLVEGTAKLPPWLYVTTGDAEYLSRCSTATTRGYVETRRARLQLLHWLVPPDFFAQMDVPATTILHSQKLRSGGAEEVIDDVLRTRERVGRDGGMNSIVTAVPNMMLDDRDSIGVFANIDEEKFDRQRLTVATDYVRFMLERRRPALPSWLIEGFVTLYAQADFVRAPITFAPLIWLSIDDSVALRNNPTRPRALLTAGELFAPETFRAEPERSPRGRVLRAQSALFVRWALDPAHGVRDRFWQFARRAGEERVTEKLFESCFGFGFSDLRDRLSDYLPLAVAAPVRLEPGALPRLPRLEVRPATPSEIARLRGEWERLTISFTRRRHPDFAERYVEQARRTLRRAREAGDRDARLEAELGLCEVDAGNDRAAREFLERAVADRVVRPRAYHELARLRFAELAVVAGAPATREFQVHEIAAVVEPLRAGLAQTPRLAETFGLLADAWARCGTAPPDTDWALLVDGARLHGRDPQVCYRIARALGRHGKTDAAVALLGKGFEHTTDDATRRQYADLYATLTKAN